MKKTHGLLACLLALILFFSLIPLPQAKATQGAATDLRGSTAITGTGYDSFAFLKDDILTTYQKSSGNTTITLENAAGMGSLYLLLHKQYGTYTVTDSATGASITAGAYGFLHEFIDLVDGFGYAPTKVTLTFANGAVQLSEIYVFSPGTVPDYVQIWEPSLDGGADILLLATHGDDDQLFFAGLLPLYAGEKDLRVQVVYLTDHRSGIVSNGRIHEMLNGLWAVGVEAYPVFGNFADFRIDSLSDTYYEYKTTYGTSKETLLGFVVEQIRRFQPQVIVGHDIKGEYGHGMHMVYTDLLIQALEITQDAAKYPESAATYGTWDVPKTYLHLYQQNQIVLDYDQPLAAFDGLTAFQATQKLGYPCHKSQQYTWFTDWLNGSSGEITKATQIKTYNPCNFGLYRSTVGEDVLKNDFMENITPYAQQEADQAAADAVSALIAALDSVTLESREAISQARSAYDALSQTQKDLVSGYDVLTAAEATYAQLMQEKAEQDAIDLAAAQQVMALIEQATALHFDDPSPDQARAAYEALTPAQKALVTNYEKLIAAEETIAQLQQQEAQNRLEQERQAQEAQEKEQAHLRRMLYLLVVLAILLLICLVALGIRQKKYRRRKAKRH